MATIRRYVPRTRSVRSLCSSANSSSDTNLKQVLASKIVQQRNSEAEFLGKYGNTKIQDLTIQMAYGGMRSLKALVCETSDLDAHEGIRFRGYTIPQIKDRLPKPANGDEPQPEAIFWLLCTGDIPNEKQVRAISEDWSTRKNLPPHVKLLLDQMPSFVHPMTQFSCALVAMSSESIFARELSTGSLTKDEFWKPVYEDALNLLANLPLITSLIYRNTYKSGGVSSINKTSTSDWTAEFCDHLGYDDRSFHDLMRLLLVLHCDHEGGNVSAHTCHLVGSALTDPYLSMAAALNGFAGPLHGMASQGVLVFLNALKQDLGESYSLEDLTVWCESHLDRGQVIPGYGHAVLRNTDPRFDCELEFAQRHMPNDPMIKLVADLYRVVPGILTRRGKAANPWPNVDAHSGVLLQHFGMTEMDFYTVLVGMSRSLGCMSQLIWSRAMQRPIERPKSMSLQGLKQLVSSFK